MIRLLGQFALKIINLLVGILIIIFIERYFSSDSEKTLLYLLLVMNLLSFLSFLGLENFVAKVRSSTENFSILPFAIISLAMNIGIGLIIFRNFEIIDLALLISACWLLAIVRFFVMFHNLDGRIGTSILSEGPVLTAIFPLIMHVSNEDLTLSIFTFIVTLCLYCVVTKPKKVYFYQSDLSNSLKTKKSNVFLDATKYLWMNKNTTMLVLLIWGMPVLVTMNLEGSGTMLLALSLMLRCNNVARVSYYLFNARELAGYLSLLEKRNYKEMRLIDCKLLLLNLISAGSFWAIVVLLWDNLIAQLFADLNYDLDVVLIATSIGFTLFGVRPQANIIQGVGTVRLILISVLAGIFASFIYTFEEEVSIPLLFVFMFLLNASLYFPLATGKVR